MLERGQDTARIETVNNSLSKLSTALIPIEQFSTNLQTTNATGTTGDSTRGKRL